MSDQPASADLARFKASIEGVDPKYREELDMDALLALKDEEHKIAGDLLIERVKVENDWRVPPAIAAIRLKRAVRAMKERLPKTKGRMRLAIARALVDLGAMERLDDTVISMLEEGDPDDGISALAAADNLSTTPELTKALARASLHHPGPEVRVNAGAALLYQAKITKDPLVWKFRPLYLVLGEEDMALRLEAFHHICELTKLPMEIAD